MYPDTSGNQNSNSNDPYGFIMNSPAKPQRSLGPGSTSGHIALAVGVAVLLIIIGLVASSLLGAGDKDQTQRLLEISQRQTEIIRLTTQADKKAKTSATKSFAVTTRLSTSSAQKDVNELLAKKGYNEKKLSKVLTASKNTKSDEALAEAEKNNRFDDTFTQLMSSELTNYRKQLQAAADGATKSQKQVLQKSFNSVATIQLQPKKSTEKPATPDTNTPDPPSEEEPTPDEEL